MHTLSHSTLGIDFGTSNSAMAWRTQGGVAQLVPLEGKAAAMPTALFFNYEERSTHYGRDAMQQYLAGEDGRLMQVLHEQAGHRLADAVEQAKIAASSTGADAALDLSWVEAGLQAHVTPQALQQHLQQLLGDVVRCAQDCVAKAGLCQQQITALYLTGGSSALQTLRAALQVAFPDTPQVAGDLFRGVASGLAYA